MTDIGESLHPCRVAVLTPSVRMLRLYRHLRRNIGVCREQANFMVMGAVIATGEGRVGLGGLDASVSGRAAHIGRNEQP